MRRFNRTISMAGLVVVSLLVAISVVVAQTDGFDLSWNTIAGGGATFSTGDGYQLGGTIGQYDAGTLTTDDTTLEGGFWHSVVTSTTSTPFAVTALVPALAEDGVAVAEVRVVAIEDRNGNAQELPGDIFSFTAEFTFSTSCASVLDVRDATSTSTDSGLEVGGVLPNPTSSPTTLTKLAVRLVGSATSPCEFAIDTLTLHAEDGETIATQETPLVESYLRGDANSNGVVNIIDAQFIAQCQVGNKVIGPEPGQCHPINSAGVRYDGPDGDGVDIVDAQFIAQYQVGLRDDEFNLK